MKKVLNKKLLLFLMTVFGVFLIMLTTRPKLEDPFPILLVILGVGVAFSLGIRLLFGFLGVREKTTKLYSYLGGLGALGVVALLSFGSLGVIELTVLVFTLTIVGWYISRVS